MKSKTIRQLRFLQVFVELDGHKKKAAKLSGIPERTVHRWFKEDKQFYRNCNELYRLAHETVILGKICDKLSLISKWF